MSTFMRLSVASENRLALLMVSMLALAGAVILAAAPLLGQYTPLFEGTCWIVAVPCVCQFATEMAHAHRQLMLERQQGMLARAEWKANIRRQIGEVR